MSVETALRQTLETRPATVGDAFAKQLGEFHAFEKRLSDSGYKIERETFSIPLMERVTLGVAYTR